MSGALRTLNVEDSEQDTLFLRRHLIRTGYDPVIHRVQTREEMVESLASEPWDLVIADYSLPTFSAPEAMTVLQQSGLDLPFIVVSGAVGEPNGSEPNCWRASRRRTSAKPSWPGLARYWPAPWTPELSWST